VISKTYNASIPYDIRLDRIIAEWTGKGTAVPVWADVDGLKETIGRLRPVKFWRHSVYREGQQPDEQIILCFAVKHLDNPGARVGDFTGNGYRACLRLENNTVASVYIEKKQ
jgi:hypothetical protein